MLTTHTLTWALALLSSASASAVLAENNDLVARQSTSDCKDVHIFLAKGWNEPYPGRQGKLAGAICYDLPSCDYEDILFENAEGTDYCKAVTQGKRYGLKAMKAYASRCPDSKLVLSGYSQGANVVGDMLDGGSGKFGDPSCFIQPSTALDPETSPGKQIAAALLFGDVRHVANQPFNYLNGSSYSSTSPRYARSLARMNEFADVTRSYCQSTDPVCAGAGPGPFFDADHLNYFDLYSDDAAGWAKWIMGF